MTCSKQSCLRGGRPPLGTGAVALAAMLVVAVPAAGHAQTGGAGENTSPASEASSGKTGRAGSRDGRGRGAKRIELEPYIEIDQIVAAQLSGGDDVLTYTQAAVGVDAAISGRNTGASASVRYERQFGWGKNARDGDAISGIARGYVRLIPALTLEAGALATQANVGSGGEALPGSGINDKYKTSIYSVFAGPSVKTRAGDLDVAANYRAGFTKVEQSNAFRRPGAAAAVDVFDESVSHVADVEAGFAPGTVLPLGIAAAGSLYQEDTSNLDQRARDMQARAMVTAPVSRTARIVGSIGYEDVEISSRDALRDAQGLPVVGSDGRYVTDKSRPRRMAYDVSGLLWDVAVMWRPSRRTSFSAHVGRRYGSTSFGGTLAYSPNDRSQLSVSVYDNVGGFGGQLNRAIDQLPDDFEVVRDPITGELRGCVASLDGGNCFSGSLGSVRSAFFRARGVTASYSMKIGRLDAGLGLGYDRRNFIAARDTILGSAAGVVDENYWLAAYIGGELGRDAGWSTSAYANWISSNDPLFGNVNGYGASASYYRMFGPRLRGTVAVGIDGSSSDRPSIDDIWTASALAGLRYSF